MGLWSSVKKSVSKAIKSASSNKKKSSSSSSSKRKSSSSSTASDAYSTARSLASGDIVGSVTGLGRLVSGGLSAYKNSSTSSSRNSGGSGSGSNYTPNPNAQPGSYAYSQNESYRATQADNARRQQMDANSKAWHNASASEKERLHAENIRLSNEMQGIGKGRYDSSSGKWSFGTDMNKVDPKVMSRAGMAVGGNYPTNDRYDLGTLAQQNINPQFNNMLEMQYDNNLSAIENMQKARDAQIKAQFEQQQIMASGDIRRADNDLNMNIEQVNQNTYQAQESGRARGVGRGIQYSAQQQAVEAGIDREGISAKQSARDSRNEQVASIKDRLSALRAGADGQLQSSLAQAQAQGYSALSDMQKQQADRMNQIEDRNFNFQKEVAMFGLKADLEKELQSRDEDFKTTMFSLEDQQKKYLASFDRETQKEILNMNLDFRSKESALDRALERQKMNASIYSARLRQAGASKSQVSKEYNSAYTAIAKSMKSLSPKATEMAQLNYKADLIKYQLNNLASPSDALFKGKSSVQSEASFAKSFGYNKVNDLVSDKYYYPIMNDLLGADMEAKQKDNEYIKSVIGR